MFRDSPYPKAPPVIRSSGADMPMADRQRARAALMWRLATGETTYVRLPVRCALPAFASRSKTMGHRLHRGLLWQQGCLVLTRSATVS
jgi:hypothetical protein